MLNHISQRLNHGYHMLLMLLPTTNHGSTPQLVQPALVPRQMTLATLKYTADERGGGWDTVAVTIGSQRGEIPVYIVRKAGAGDLKSDGCGCGCGKATSKAAI